MSFSLRSSSKVLASTMISRSDKRYPGSDFNLFYLNEDHKT
jgi:hypothetical protein